MKRVIPGLVLGTAVLAISAAAAPAQDAPRAAGEAWAYIHALSPQERQEVLEREAHADGGIVIYGVTGLDRLQFYAEQFNQRYPDISVDLVRLTTAEAPQRLQAEHRAGRVGADIIIDGPNIFTAFPELIAPYESVEWENFPSYLQYGSYEDGATGVAYELFPTAIAWRTDRGLDEATIPATLEELTDEGWRGRVGTLFSLEGVVGGLIEREGEEAARDLLERLANLENRLYSSHAALADALSIGEIDLVWNLATHRTTELQTLGAPIEWHHQDPLIASANVVFATQGSNSPYAAALFIDTLLSPEVLEAYDALFPSLLYGNGRGSYAYDIADFPTLSLVPVGDVDELREWGRIKEELFVRRQQ